MTTWLNTSFRTQFRVVDGLKAFAGRVRRELPGTVRQRAAGTAGELTAREAQVARLACDGRGAGRQEQCL